MVIVLGLAAAALYGTGDFLGGLATRRVQVLVVLLLAETAGVIVALPAAVMSPGPARLAGLAWGISAGLVGGLGLIIFYTGLAAGPMSVVAPVSGLASTVLPVAVALAEGERPGAGVYAGALLCLAAIVLAISATDGSQRGRDRRRREHLLRRGHQDRHVRPGSRPRLALPRGHRAAGQSGARRAAALGPAGRPRP